MNNPHLKIKERVCVKANISFVILYGSFEDVIALGYI